MLHGKPAEGFGMPRCMSTCSGWKKENVCLWQGHHQKDLEHFGGVVSEMQVPEQGRLTTKVFNKHDL